MMTSRHRWFDVVWPISKAQHWPIVSPIGTCIVPGVIIFTFNNSFYSMHLSCMFSYKQNK